MNVVLINKNDNVAVATEMISGGERVTAGKRVFTCLSDVEPGHKIASADIGAGERVIKYGYPIGYATREIKTGEWVHKHNIKSALTGSVPYEYVKSPPEIKPVSSDTFMGFRRANGKVGVRNEIWIIPTVCCVNSIGEIIAKRANNMASGSVSGVYCFPHQFGCSQTGADFEATKRVLCALAKHPNAGGVLILGLGCENNQAADMMKEVGRENDGRVKYLNCQEREDEIGAAFNMLHDLIETAKGDAREKTPVSELIIGLKCGGSDGLSGITANPLVGALSDMVVSQGGSSILTEVPEMFGAEAFLLERCATREVFNECAAMINNFKAYLLSQGENLYDNPSPGNIEGGLSTLEDKALGCTQKSGFAPVAGVLPYAAPLVKRGLNLLNSPGNDLVSITALAASGAHIILFTTGRGTPLGSPVPVIKISSSTALYAKKPNWLDFNAGLCVESGSPEGLKHGLYKTLLSVASGETLTKSEKQGIRDISILKTGVTL